MILIPNCFSISGASSYLAWWAGFVLGTDPRKFHTGLWFEISKTAIQIFHAFSNLLLHMAFPDSTGGQIDMHNTQFRHPARII